MPRKSRGSSKGKLSRKKSSKGSTPSTAKTSIPIIIPKFDENDDELGGEDGKVWSKIPTTLKKKSFTSKIPIPLGKPKLKFDEDLGEDGEDNVKSSMGITKNKSTSEIKKKVELDEVAEEVVRKDFSIVGSEKSTFSAIDLSMFENMEEEYGEVEIKESSDSIFGMIQRLTFNDDRAFDDLKEILTNVINYLKRSKFNHVNIDPIKSHFVNVWEAIEKSHENEQKLIKKDRELSCKLSDSMAKTRFLIKLAENDPETSTKLGRRLERLWHDADEGEGEEAEAQTKINKLKEDIFTLAHNIEASAKVEGQETIKELIKLKHQLTLERTQLGEESEQIKDKLKEVFMKRQKLHEHKKAVGEKIKALTTEEEVQKSSFDKEEARRNEISQNIRNAQDELNTKTNELQHVKDKIEKMKSSVITLRDKIKDQMMQINYLRRDAEVSQTRTEKLRIDEENQIRTIDRVASDLLQKNIDFKMRSTEIDILRSEHLKVDRERRFATKKVILARSTLLEIEKDREDLKNKIKVLEKEVEDTANKVNENQRKVDSLDRERAMVTHQLERANAITDLHLNQVKDHQLAVYNLKFELSTFEKENMAQKELILKLEKERDYYISEASKYGHLVNLRLEEIKRLDMNIFDQRKQLGYYENQLKKQQQIFETAMYDKTIYEKNLRDSNDTILENVLAIRHLSHNVSVLKYQVAQKDEILHEEALRYDRTIKEIEFYESECVRIGKLATDYESTTIALEAETATIKCAIAEGDSEISKQKYYMNSAETRARGYERKLMHKNDELKKVWDNWRVLRSSCRIGSYHYRNIMNDIIKFRNTMMKLKWEGVQSKKMVFDTKKLDKESIVLQNLIARERCMCNSLEYYMNRPTNIHRWRKMRIYDPPLYLEILQLRELTRQTVKRADEAGIRQKLIDEESTVYIELNERLHKETGIETPEVKRYYKHLYMAKKEQYKCLKVKFETAEAKVEFFNNEIDCLKGEFDDLKRRFFETLGKNPNFVKDSRYKMDLLKIYQNLKKDELEDTKKILEVEKQLAVTPFTPCEEIDYYGDKEDQDLFKERSRLHLYELFDSESSEEQEMAKEGKISEFEMPGEEPLTEYEGEFSPYEYEEFKQMEVVEAKKEKVKCGGSKKKSLALTDLNEIEEEDENPFLGIKESQGFDTEDL